MIAEVEQLVECEALLADSVEPHINLQPRALLLQRCESSLALRANGHDAPRHCHCLSFGLKLFTRRRVPLGAYLCQRRRKFALRGRKPVGISGLPQFRDLLQFFPALVKKLALEFRVEFHTSFSGFG